MKKLLLSGKHSSDHPYALVDDIDYPRVCGYSWRAQGPADQVYVCRTENLPGRKTRTVFLHREILGLAQWTDNDVHHRNGITTDNRRENLIVLPRREHVAIHSKLVPVSGHCAGCGEHYTRYVHLPLARRVRYCAGCSPKKRSYVKPTECPVCSTWFVTRHPKGIYCGDPCRAKAWGMGAPPTLEKSA